MVQVIQITAVCLIGALLALVLRRGTPELAMALCLGTAAVAALCLAGELGEILALLEELAELSGVSWEFLSPLYKTVGIALVVRIGGNLCRDAGESALAGSIETAGAVCALLAAMPLMRAVLSYLTELMR